VVKRTFMKLDPLSCLPNQCMSFIKSFFLTILINFVNCLYSKNSVEIQGFRNSHIRDATALCEYFAWLEYELVVKKNTSITEVDAADKLESIRRYCSRKVLNEI
jgi:hypothetical protein